MSEKEKLLLDFFMLGLLAAPFAEFFELDFFGYQFLVFTGPVIYALAGSAREFYESIL